MRTLPAVENPTIHPEAPLERVGNPTPVNGRRVGDRTLSPRRGLALVLATAAFWLLPRIVDALGLL